ncbi:DUF721 domain-containing protein [Paremcibacter congregatus]|uniref:DUF721 domain-containing protein n=1 Tax=Paremcibacter congregatus TaxID=2043170 RepID=UPI003A95A228|tara:strand:+ start:411 stop:953 length:543 start_codon:yes stop_codon:yes gene_type:complete
MKTKAIRKPKTLAEAVQGVSNRAFRRFGFSQREIISRWPEIVGAALADCSLPERLTFPQDDKRGGTLYIRIQGSMAPELQHFEPMVIERINAYYGYPAVERLSYRHGPVPTRTRKTRRPDPVLSDSQQKDLAEQLKGVTNPELYQALYRLGAEVVAEKKPDKPKDRLRFTRRGMGRRKPM